MYTIRRIALEKVRDKLIGGKADNMTIEDIAKKHNVEIDHIKTQLTKGIDVEMEHTNDPNLSKEIAKDHLTENPDYYTHLEKMERKFKNSSFQMILFLIKQAEDTNKPSQWTEPVMDLPPLPLSKSKTVIFTYIPGNPGKLTITTPEIRLINPTPLIEKPVTSINELPELIGILREEISDKIRGYGTKEQKTGVTHGVVKASKIVKRPDGYHVISEKGKHLGGPYSSKEKAKKRLQQVEMFKHINSMRRNTIVFLRVALNKNDFENINEEELRKLDQKLKNKVPITQKDLSSIVNPNTVTTLKATTNLTLDQITKELVAVGKNIIEIRKSFEKISNLRR